MEGKVKSELLIAKEMVPSILNESIEEKIRFAHPEKRTANPYEEEAPQKFADKLREIQGTIMSFDKKSNKVSLKLQGEVKYLFLTKDTVRNKEYNKFIQGDEVVSLAIETNEGYVAVSFLRADAHKIFENVSSLFGKCRAVKDYFELTKTQRENINTQQNAKRYPIYFEGEKKNFSSQKELWLKYMLCKNTYPFETQGEIEALFKEFFNSKHKSSDKLERILNISPVSESRKMLNYNEFIAALDKRLYKLDKEKQLFAELLVSNAFAGIRGANILLVGSPGVGKTSLVEAVAEICGMQYDSIKLNGMSNPLEWEGLDSSYDSSDVGRPIKCFRKSYTSEMLVMIDELDKMCLSKDGNPMNCLYNSLTGEHEDKFLEVTLNTENTVYVATANSIEDIPEAIVNRFHVIYVEDYELEDKVVIAKKYAFPQLMKMFHLEKEEISFSDEALIEVINYYCEDAGARDLKRAIEMIVRKIICKWDKEAERYPVKVDTAFVQECLETRINFDLPGIKFNRNRTLYSQSVKEEIQKSLNLLKVKKFTGNEQLKRSEEKRLEYLLALKGEKVSMNFDPDGFQKKIHSTHYGMDELVERVTTFYYLTSLQPKLANGNLALIGGAGVGKSSVCRCIADAMDYAYCKVALNGCKDENSLKGFPSTYVGADAGLFLKEIRRVGTLKVVFQLDEIDKLSNEMSYVLLDLLDRSFTDNFVGVSIDLSNCIFIATANDWSAVDPLLRDRFMPVEVEGYTSSEKASIVEHYIIPKIEENYKEHNVKVRLEDDAKYLLLDKYCPSFGVRDAEKAVEKLVGDKLRKNYGQDNAMSVHITEQDVRDILGKEPMKRGNFPEKKMPGVSKALAVTESNCGNAFAIETVLIPDEKNVVEITGLPMESAVDSVKIAINYVKRNYPDKLKDKGIHLHFSEGAVKKDGPSAGVAIMMSILSAALNKPIEEDAAYTGEIDLFGGVFAIGGVMQKIQAAATCAKVFVPYENYERVDKEKIKEFTVEVIPVRHVSEVIEVIFPEFEVA